MNWRPRIIVILGVLMVFGGFGKIELCGSEGAHQAFWGMNLGLLSALIGGLVILAGLSYNKTKGEKEK